MPPMPDCSSDHATIMPENGSSEEPSTLKVLRIPRFLCGLYLWTRPQSRLSRLIAQCDVEGCREDHDSAGHGPQSGHLAKQDEGDRGCEVQPGEIGGHAKSMRQQGGTLESETGGRRPRNRRGQHRAAISRLRATICSELSVWVSSLAHRPMSAQRADTTSTAIMASPVSPKPGWRISIPPLRPTARVAARGGPIRSARNGTAPSARSKGL